MADLQSDIDDLARETSFSGAVSVRTATGTGSWAQAWGLAHRGLDVPCTTDTRFAMASGTKGFTALAVLSLIGGQGSPNTVAMVQMLYSFMLVAWLVYRWDRFR